MTLEPLLTLLRYFDAYQQAHDSDDLRRFALWLYKQADAAAEPPLPRVGAYDIHREIAYLLTRFEKYSQRYARLVLRDLPISTHDDFALLTAIGRLDQPSKNEVYQATLLEVTTGAQALRRLVRLELVEEWADATDRRVRRVRLTPKGERVHEEAFAAFGKVIRLKLGNLTDDQQTELLSLLRTLEDFHRAIYEAHPEPDLAMLMDTYLLASATPEADDR